jgi:hypothetical protein
LTQRIGDALERARIRQHARREQRAQDEVLERVFDQYARSPEDELAREMLEWIALAAALGFALGVLVTVTVLEWRGVTIA